jgi:hypothetical protein
MAEQVLLEIFDRWYSNNPIIDKEPLNRPVLKVYRIE